MNVLGTGHSFVPDTSRRRVGGLSGDASPPGPTRHGCLCLTPSSAAARSARLSASSPPPLDCGGVSVAPRCASDASAELRDVSERLQDGGRRPLAARLGSPVRKPSFFPASSWRTNKRHLWSALLLFLLCSFLVRSVSPKMANRYSQPALTSAEALASAAPDALDDDRRERQDARDKAPEESNSPQGVFEGGEAAARVSRKSPREFAADAELSRSRDASSGRNDNDESAENQGNLAAQASSHEDPAAALCRDWRTPHAFLSKAATAESLRIPPKLDLTAALMPFYFYGHDKRGNYILVTKFSDFNVPMIRRQLSDLDIRSFFRFKNLAWFGRIAPSPTASSIVVSDAAGTDIARVVLQGGILVAKSYVQAMTSTIPDVGVRVSEIHIMNVPRAAAFLLGIVRALSPKEIQFFTYASRQEFLDKMGDVIGLENLPTHFGGTNAVPIHISELEACFDEFVREARAAEVERRLKELERQEEKERQEMERQFHFLFD